MVGLRVRLNDMGDLHSVLGGVSEVGIDLVLRIDYRADLHLGTPDQVRKASPLFMTELLKDQTLPRFSFQPLQRPGERLQFGLFPRQPIRTYDGGAGIDVRYLAMIPFTEFIRFDAHLKACQFLQFDAIILCTYHTRAPLLTGALIAFPDSVETRNSGL
jgi:hypothetical protein